MSDGAWNSSVNSSANDQRAVPNQLIAQNLRRVLVHLHGHETEGKMHCISYHWRVVNSLLIAVLYNQLKCERKSTAIVVAIVMQHDFYAILAHLFA